MELHGINIMENLCGCGFCIDVRRRKDERDIDEFI